MSNDTEFLRMTFQRGGDQRYKLDEIAAMLGFSPSPGPPGGALCYANPYHEVEIDFRFVPPRVRARELPQP